MSQSIEYMIAQYIQDPMRREPRNIGIVVLHNGSSAGRFFGETETPGEIDGRVVKRMPYVDIYRKWVKYWHQELKRGGDDLKARLIKNNGDNYDMIPGGFVTDFDDESAAEVCDRLYSMLVSGGDLVSAESEGAEVEASLRGFRTEITREFRKLDIIAGQPKLDVPHPIYVGTSILGARGEHTPAYYQDAGGAPYVMETLNFSTSRIGLAKYHAGWASRMFEDVREKNMNAKAIAIVRGSLEKLKEKTVDNALKLFDERYVQLVRWNLAAEQKGFLLERVRMARNGFATSA